MSTTAVIPRRLVVRRRRWRSSSANRALRLARLRARLSLGTEEHPTVAAQGLRNRPPLARPRSYAVLATATAGALVLAGCSSPAPKRPSQTLTVAVEVARTGPDAAVGAAILRGAQAAAS